MSDVQLPITGGCLCKAVRFTAKAPPLAVRQCWCRDCQNFWAGSSTGNLLFETAVVSITGAHLIFT